MNFFCLALFTVVESFLLGIIAARLKPDLVLMAVGITASVVFVLTIFAFQTKWDFTKMGGFLLVFVTILFMFGLISLIIRSKRLTLIYASLGVLLFSFHLVYDTQLMIGGDHEHSISPEEYIFAALSIYMDVISIFTYLLMLLGIGGSG